MTRRTILLSTLSAATFADAARAQQHAHTARASQAPFRVLTPADAAEIEALAAQILPTDETPGAREAGCIYFIDRALETFDKDKRVLYQEGLAAAQKKRAEMYPDSRSIAGLTGEGQAVALLQAIESSAFFQLLRTHVIMGFLAAPEWGGNRGMVGWTHIGLEHKMVFAPPFGYYDGEAAK